MIWPAIYATIKYWGPLLTFGGLFVKGFFSIKKGISTWADTLLDNHMAHIQLAAEKAAVAVTELASYHKDTLESQKEMVVELSGVRKDLANNGELVLETMKDMRQDFMHSQATNIQVQGAILTGIEVLKVKVD